MDSLYALLHVDIEYNDTSSVPAYAGVTDNRTKGKIISKVIGRILSMVYVIVVK